MTLSTGAPPTNPEVYGLNDKAPAAEQTRLRVEIKDKMVLHLELLRGRGFWSWMHSADPAKKPKESEDLAAQTAALTIGSPAPRQLPSVRFLSLDNDALVRAIVDQTLPEDRMRFSQYMRDRPLGLGLVTAVGFPGSYLPISFPSADIKITGTWHRQDNHRCSSSHSHAIQAGSHSRFRANARGSGQPRSTHRED